MCSQVNNIVIEGFVSSIAVSLQHLCEILDPLIIAKHEMLPLFEVKIELQDSRIIFDPPFQSSKPGEVSLRSTIDGWLKDFFATVTCMQRLDTNSGDYLSEIREHFQMQCLLALVSELIDNTEMKCMDYRETFMQHSRLLCTYCTAFHILHIHIMHAYIIQKHVPPKKLHYINICTLIGFCNYA